MAPSDATQINVVRWDMIRDGVHRHLEMEPAAQVTAYIRQARPRREPEPQPCRRGVLPQPRRQDVLLEPVYQPLLHRDYYLGINPVPDVRVYSAIGVRSGYRMVMGNSGSRRRKVAKAAAVVGGILVAKAIF